MPRPRKCCQVDSLPGFTYFKPARIPMSELEENQLTIEELEAIRLRDIEDLDQEACAAKMNISRATFQRVLASARKKIADSLLNGKAIKISGGNFISRLDSTFRNCPGNEEKDCCAATGNVKNSCLKKEKTLKIAVITDDETTISQHFGMAQMYEVFTVENGKIVNKESRAKKGHQQLGGGHHSHSHAPGQPHGLDADSENKHATMAQPISDCQVLIAGGMGMGAYQSLKSYNIEPLITDVNNIDEAVKLYVEGKLPNLREKLH